MASSMIAPEEPKPEVLPAERTMRSVVISVSVIVLAGSAVGFALLYFAVAYQGVQDRSLLPIIRSHFLACTAIPLSVVIAVAVVQFFRQAHGPIDFEFKGAKFSGATGPVILWIFCFLAVTWASGHLWGITD